MQTIPFVRPPAWVTIGEGLSVAARYWAASWERWILAVAAVAIADGLTTWLIGPTVIDQRTLVRLMGPGADSIDAAALPRLLAGPAAVALVSLVADWFLYANAVAGLRGREVTLGWVVGSGLRMLLVLVGLSLLFAVLLSILALLGPLGLVAMLVLLPVLVYVAIRLTFWTLGVFDGLGVAAAARSSWALTRGAMLRVIGWSLALFGLSVLFSVVSATVSVAFAGLPVVPAIAGSLLATALQAYAVIVMAILYESQRLRSGVWVEPSRTGFGPGWEGHVLPPPPSWSGDQRSHPVMPAPSQPDPAPNDPDAPPPPPPLPPAPPAPPLGPGIDPGSR